MVTIYDIAKRCNCSSATVSKVFNNVGNISEKKRREVLAVARELGYVPNVTARNLVKKHSNTVGVLLFVDESLGLRYELFADILNYFRSEMEANNYEIVLISEKGTQWEGDYLTHCRALRLDGVFCLCCNYNSESIRNLFESDIPVVGFEAPSSLSPSIESKNFEASKQLTEYLIARGHRDIAFLAGSDLHITSDRIEGYQAALREHGIPFDERLLLRCEYFSNDQGALATKLLLDCGKKVTAAMYPDDFTAIAAYRDLARAGIRVGKDISVTGFDGIMMGRIVTPQLATIRQDTAKIGKTAAHWLMKLIEGEQIAEPRLRLDAAMLEGDSVASPHPEG